MLPEPLEQLTRTEAEWLHRHRHVDYVHRIIVAKNMATIEPLNPEARIGWNKAVREWRASDFYPGRRNEKDAY